MKRFLLLVALALTAGFAGANDRTPEEERTQMLQSLSINRSNSGILETRLQYQRENKDKDEEPGLEAVEEKPKPAATESQPLEKASGSGEEEPKKELSRQEKLNQYRQDIAKLKINVVLGFWPEVKSYLESLPEQDAKTAHSRILSQLAGETSVSPREELASLGATSHSQEQYVRPLEILDLSDVAKRVPDDSTIELLANLMKRQMPLPEAFFDELKEGTRYFGLDSHEARVKTADLLLASGLVEKATEFLPELETAIEKKDYVALNLLARYHAAAHHEEMAGSHLPDAWGLSLDVIGAGEAPLSQRAKALYRALALVPELEGEAGKEWLAKTFADASTEGFEILSSVGTLTAQTRNHRRSSFRLEQLKLQSAAASALLGSNDDDLEPWREILTLYVRNWIAEADRTVEMEDSRGMRPQQRYDNFGNVYYEQISRSYNSNQIPPVEADELARIRPDDLWLEQIDPPIRLEFLASASALLLQEKDEKAAFELLKLLAKERPAETKRLVRRMIQVWAENNNPNQEQNYRSQYYYYSRYNQVAESIPLTRSKQERNLINLSSFVDSVRELKLDENFEDELSDAFIQAHSKAEVWRIESLEKVFGPVESLDPETITSLLQRMRQNLAGLWPDPKLQQQANTKRTDKELKAQILYGYKAARDLCASAVKKHPESWSLPIQLAALKYEESNYRAVLDSHPEHSTIKVDSVEAIGRAAGNYIESLPLEKEADESVESFLTWFYAALGSPDLGALKGHHQPIPAEFPKIKAAFESIPEECRERHYSQFASVIDSRLANVSADLKYRYLESALSIIGFHEEIDDGAKVFEYYKDLNTEIQLVTRVDGSDTISSGQPFGVFVDLLHTREIERESGGFSKYLTNQNSSRYSYNYGRPKEDYRDKFEESSRAILEEHFEIVSLTFHNPKVESRTASQIGWTMTPYAYFLLKPKGQEVDTIPPLKIDLDFLDTSGSVILPVASAAIPLDASSSSSEPRPYRDLSLTMILDDREAEANQQIALEVRGAGHGLVPELEYLIQLPLEGWQLIDTEDRELQVEELDATTDDGAPLSTHEWRLVFEPEGDNLPATFSFPDVLAQIPADNENSLILQKFDDVDLVSVGPVISLLAGSEESGPSWMWYLLIPLAIAVVIFKLKPKSEVEPDEGPEIPEKITPVTVLSYLENISGAQTLKVQDSEKLEKEILRIKENSFAPDSSPPSMRELEKVALQWKQIVEKGAA